MYFYNTKSLTLGKFCAIKRANMNDAKTSDGLHSHRLSFIYQFGKCKFHRITAKNGSFLGNELKSQLNCLFHFQWSFAMPFKTFTELIVFTNIADSISSWI